jgi:hypothetical protein
MRPPLPPTAFAIAALFVAAGCDSTSLTDINAKGTDGVYRNWVQEFHDISAEGWADGCHYADPQGNEVVFPANSCHPAGHLTEAAPVSGTELSSFVPMTCMWVNPETGANLTDPNDPIGEFRWTNFTCADWSAKANQAERGCAFESSPYEPGSCRFTNAFPGRGTTPPPVPPPADKTGPVLFQEAAIACDAGQNECAYFASGDVWTCRDGEWAHDDCSCSQSIRLSDHFFLTDDGPHEVGHFGSCLAE